VIDEIYAFPDTNILIHYKPLAQIDWCGVLEARSVVLVICMPVIDELDQKKSDPRLTDRAKRAIKDIAEYGTAAKPIGPRVRLEIYNEQLLRGEVPDSVSPDSHDDQIIQLVRKYAGTHSERQTCVVTEDLGMRIRCQATNVSVHEMAESERLENPGDEKDRKLKQLQAELATIKNRMPRLSITAAEPGQAPADQATYQWKMT
jgi:predicted ribonuclease YlaK